MAREAAGLLAVGWLAGVWQRGQRDGWPDGAGDAVSAAACSLAVTQLAGQPARWAAGGAQAKVFLPHAGRQGYSIGWPVHLFGWRGGCRMGVYSRCLVNLYDTGAPSFMSGYIGAC